MPSGMLSLTAFRVKVADAWLAGIITWLGTVISLVSLELRVIIKSSSVIILRVIVAVAALFPAFSATVSLSIARLKLGVNPLSTMGRIAV